jgi:hypothetical protein
MSLSNLRSSITEKWFQVVEAQYQGTEFEFTVVLKLNQGTIRKRGVIVFGALFAYFLGKQKVRAKNI